MSLRERALKRLNIIKIFSHKFWHLNKSTLVNIYISLISSLFNYAFFGFANISEESVKPPRVQNRAIRCIFRLDWNSLNSEITQVSGILPIKNRFIQLGCRYLSKALIQNKFIMRLTTEFYWSRSKLHLWYQTHSNRNSYLIFNIGKVFASLVFLIS